MTTSKGTIQGMAYVTAADEKHQIIVHAQAFGMGQEQATLKLTVGGIKKNFGDGIFKPSLVLTADIGFSKVTCLDLMKQKIDSSKGRRMYNRRMWTIEPVFGNITSNKGLSRISVRDEAKATAQWLMYSMVHNVEKLWKNSKVESCA
ncbi:MAG: hypothetical protein ACJAR6_001121 [Oleispira sp.]|jgi:hypothetical protein